MSELTPVAGGLGGGLTSAVGVVVWSSPPWVGASVLTELEASNVLSCPGITAVSCVSVVSTGSWQEMSSLWGGGLLLAAGACWISGEGGGVVGTGPTTSWPGCSGWVTGLRGGESRAAEVAGGSGCRGTCVEAGAWADDISSGWGATASVFPPLSGTDRGLADGAGWTCALTTACDGEPELESRSKPITLHYNQLLEDNLRWILEKVYHIIASLISLCSSPERVTVLIVLLATWVIAPTEDVLTAPLAAFCRTDTHLLPLRASYSLRMSAAIVGWLHSSSAEMNSSGQFSLLFRQSRRSTMLSKFPHSSRLASMFSYIWIELFSATANVQHIWWWRYLVSPTLSWSVRHGRWGIISLTFTLDTMADILRRRYPLYSWSLANVICEVKVDSNNNFCYIFYNANTIIVI